MSSSILFALVAGPNIVSKGYNKTDVDLESRHPS